MQTQVAKERNLCNLKRKALTSRTRKQQDLSTTDSSDNDEEGEGTRFYSDNKGQTTVAPTVAGEPARPPKKKSRWGPSPSSSSSSSMITTQAAASNVNTPAAASVAGSSKPAQW